MSKSRWKVLVRRYPSGPVVAEVPFQEILFSSELNGPGGGSCSFDLDSEFLAKGNSYEEIIERTNIWEFYQDEVCVAQFQAESPQIEYVSESRARRVTVSGNGLASALQHGLVLPPMVDSYPKLPGFPYNSGFFWSIAPFARASNLITDVTANFSDDPVLTWKCDIPNPPEVLPENPVYTLYKTDGTATVNATVELDKAAGYNGAAGCHLIKATSTAAIDLARLQQTIFVEEEQSLKLRVAINAVSLGGRSITGYVQYCTDEDVPVAGGTFTTNTYSGSGWQVLVSNTTVPKNLKVTKAIVGVKATTGSAGSSFRVGAIELVTALDGVDKDTAPRAANMMTHWYEMYGVVRRRFANDSEAAVSPLTRLSVTFDAYRDSYGNPWPQDAEHTFGDSSIDESQNNGVSLLDLLETCSAAAGGTRADWSMRPVWNGSGWTPTLECAMNYGRDLSQKIAFFPTNMYGLSREIKRDDIRNFPVAQSDDGAVAMYANQYKTILSRSKYGRRETYIPTTMAEDKHPYLDKEMHLYSDELSSWTVTIPAEVTVAVVDPATAPNHELRSTLYRPFIDYSVGDWIGLPTVGNANLPDKLEKLRITALSGTVKEDGQLTIEVTLGSNIQLLRESQSAERS